MKLQNYKMSNGALHSLGEAERFLFSLEDENE